jgi:hypothetical protein
LRRRENVFAWRRRLHKHTVMINVARARVCAHRTFDSMRAPSIGDGIDDVAATLTLVPYVAPPPPPRVCVRAGCGGCCGCGVCASRATSTGDDENDDGRVAEASTTVGCARVRV